MKKTSIISIFGAPGAGKSTVAADCFCTLKRSGLSCDLVTEEARIAILKGIELDPVNQFFVTLAQMRREELCIGRVDVIVTDSPAWLGLFYLKYAHPDNEYIERLEQKINEYYARRECHALSPFFLEL
jgi:KaiC/GvpD/RAD55 family RecA-like ATPase